MDKQRKEFRNIMKGTTIFGGTQLLSMLISIVRGKFVAMTLGAYGMGINSLLMSALQPIQMLFSLGMPQSAVSIIASTKNDDDPQLLHKTIKSFRRILTVMSALALTFTILFAPWISEATLSKEQNFSMWFMALGIAVFFMIQAVGNNAILQAYRSLKRLAMCNIAAALSSLIICIPFYIFMGVQGIAPAIIFVAISTWAFSQWHVSRLKLGHIHQTWSETYSISKPIIMLGLTMMVSGLLGNLCVYLINTFIRSYGNMSDVGFYQASINITLQCTALIFTALATDYLPKLSTLTDKVKICQLIEQEGEIVLLLCAPISTLLIAFAPIVVRVLLTEDFLVIVPVVQMMALTFMMRAVHFPLDYMSIVKNDKKFFFWTEGILTNVKNLAIFTLAYYHWGLIGLGYASLINGITDITVSFTLIPWRFGVMYRPKIFRLIAILFSLTTMTLLAGLYFEGFPQSVCLVLGSIVVCLYSIRELNKRLDLRQLIANKIKRA